MTSTSPTSSPATTDPVASSRRDPISDWLDVFMRLLELKPSESRAVRDELEDHLRSRVDDLIITGASEHDAVRTAVAELGETAILAKRFKHAQHPNRRRTLMSTALVAVAASALTLGAFSIVSPPASLTTAAGQAAPNTIIGLVDPPEGEAAPFNERLRRYDLKPLRLTQRLNSEGQPVIDSEAIDRLMHTMQTLVTTDSWEDYGGDQASYSIYGTTLYVQGEPETHTGVQWVLQGLIAEADEQDAAYEAQRAANEAAAEADYKEQMQRQEEARARAEAERRQRQSELEAQYHNLTEHYIDLTREMAQLMQEREQVEDRMALAQQRAEMSFATEQSSLREQLGIFERERDALVNQVVDMRATNQTDSDHFKSIESRLQVVQTELQSIQHQFGLIRQKTVDATQEERTQLGHMMAEYTAREAELNLRYEDTEVRLNRVRSVLLDLELAEYTGGLIRNGAGAWRDSGRSGLGVAGNEFDVTDGVSDAIQQAVLGLARDHQDLTEQVQITLLSQARDIAMLMIQHADQHNGALPTKPSQLRGLAQASGHDYSLFLDAKRRIAISNLDLEPEQAWAWVDVNSSFELVEGKLYESDSVIVRTRLPLPGGNHVMAFGDSHAEVVTPEDHAARQAATTDRTISISGDVSRAGTYQLPEGEINLARMLAAAGAEPSDSLYARLIRADDQVWSAKLAKALNQDNEDSPKLYPGDRIVIAASPFAR